MTKILPLSDKKKLRVIFRVEPGCLGPDGENLIGDFGQFAQPLINLQNSPERVNWADLIICELAPRNDKSRPEIQYVINAKILSHDKAVRYFALFNKQLDGFEHELNEKLSDLIDEYLS